MDELILSIMSISLKLRIHGIHVDTFLFAHLGIFNVQIYVLGWQPHTEPTIKRAIDLKKNDVGELVIINDFLKQLLDKAE